MKSLFVVLIGLGGVALFAQLQQGGGTSTAFLSATQSGIWNVRTQDGSGNALASATSTPGGSVRGLVTRNIPNGTQDVNCVSGCSTGGSISVSNFPATQAVSAASLPLPSGAATEASLGGLSAKIPSSLVGGRLDVNVGNSPGVAGTTAHGSTGTSVNPLLNGCVALSHGANPTAVSANQIGRCYANVDGIPWMIGGHPNVVTRQFYWTSGQTDAAIATVSSGAKIVVTRASVTCSGANSVKVAVRMGFGASTLPTAPTDGNSAAGVLLTHDGVSPGSGVVEGVGSGILGVGADGEDLRITTGVATGGSCSAIVSYYALES